MEENEAIPKDVRLSPSIFIFGKTKSGKTTLAESLRDKFGFKIITIEELITEFVQEHEDSDIKSILN